MSTLSRLSDISRPKTPFHAKSELTATSFCRRRSTYPTFDACARCVASNSAEPGGVSLRTSACSTWSSGDNRILSFRWSAVSGGCVRVLASDGVRPLEGRGLLGVNGWAWAVCASVMASRMMRTERTTLRWITARHDARSARKACSRSEVTSA